MIEDHNISNIIKELYEVRKIVGDKTQSEWIIKMLNNYTRGLIFALDNIMDRRKSFFKHGKWLVYWKKNGKIIFAVKKNNKYYDFYAPA